MYQSFVMIIVLIWKKSYIILNINNCYKYFIFYFSKDCAFIDIPFEHDELEPFCRQQITGALESLGLELSNDGRPLSEILEPDLR